MTSRNETHTADPTAPIVCTLSAERAADQLSEWTELQHIALSRQPIDGGARLTFPVALAEPVRDLARREAGCCAFLTITTTIDGDVLVLDVTAGDPAGQAVVASLAGVPTP